MSGLQVRFLCRPYLSTVYLNSMNNVSSTQFVLQARKQHYRIMETQRISFLSGLTVAIAVPVILNAASLSWNPNKIAKDNGIVILAQKTAKPAPKARMNVDSNGVILKGYDPVAYFTRHQAVKGNPEGDVAGGERALDFLFNVQQRPDGSFAQNTKVDGTR